MNNMIRHAMRRTAKQHPCYIADEATHPRFQYVERVGTSVLVIVAHHEAIEHGGPYWAATGRSRDRDQAETLARFIIAGAGDPDAGTWEDEAQRLRGWWHYHLAVRTTPLEAAQAKIHRLRDLRGTVEERERLVILRHDVPDLMARLPADRADFVRRVTAPVVVSSDAP